MQYFQFFYFYRIYEFDYIIKGVFSKKRKGNGKKNEKKKEREKEKEEEKRNADHKQAADLSNEPKEYYT